MSSFLERIRERFDNSCFCYAKPGGQGFVNKSECICSKECPCQAKLDAERFHEAFNGMPYGDIRTRNEIIKEIKPDFKDSQWYKDNVIE